MEKQKETLETKNRHKQKQKGDRNKRKKYIKIYRGANRRRQKTLQHKLNTSRTINYIQKMDKRKTTKRCKNTPESSR